MIPCTYTHAPSTSTVLTFKHFIIAWIYLNSAVISTNSNSTGLLASIFFFLSIFICRAWSICYLACCFSLSLADIMSRIFAFTAVICPSIWFFCSAESEVSFSYLRWFWISELYFCSTSCLFFSIRLFNLSFCSYFARSASEICFEAAESCYRCQFYWVYSGLDTTEF